MTKQREAILQVIRAERRHYTAEEIFELARAILPTISRATVYNNLHAMEREELVRRITGEDSKDRYDGCFTPHGHLYCTECDRIWDFEIPNLSEIIEEIGRAHV